MPWINHFGIRVSVFGVRECGVRIVVATRRIATTRRRIPPVPAPRIPNPEFRYDPAVLAQLVERVHGKDEVVGSIPTDGSTLRSDFVRASGGAATSLSVVMIVVTRVGTEAVKRGRL
jgi:hypothetical protein